MIKILKKQKCIGLLLDPDNYGPDDIRHLFSLNSAGRPDFIFVGGSITSVHPDNLIAELKKITDIPVVLFPGNLLQLSDKADHILFLSLISGRNPELLIGNHVIAAPHIKQMKSRVIPTGYILINCGVKTSVEYISQTEAIPSSKKDIAVATALAGELLGMKLIYLEGGSGAEQPVPLPMLKAVSDAVSVPVITGGGLRTAAQVEQAYRSGADMVILGNGCEDKPGLLTEACRIRDNML